jgi:hypothetical protein
VSFQISTIGRIHAGAEALDLFPRIVAVGRHVEAARDDLARANLEQRVRAAQPAWRRAAHLHVRSLPTGESRNIV